MEKLSKDFTLVVSPLAAFKLFTKNKLVLVHQHSSDFSKKNQKLKPLKRKKSL
jgi:hypothetical protein